MPQMRWWMRKAGVDQSRHSTQSLVPFPRSNRSASTWFVIAKVKTQTQALTTRDCQFSSLKKKEKKRNTYFDFHLISYYTQELF